MKKVLFVLTLLFVGPLSVKPQAESKEPSKGNNYFYVSPINLFLSTLELGYERKLACHNTFVVLGAVKLSKKDNYFDRTGGSGAWSDYLVSSGGRAYRASTAPA